MVIWFIGMSASGKTTIGKKLYEKLKNTDEKWIFLDGDMFRNILDKNLGHTLEERRINTFRISRFCELLSFQKINVIACVLNIFHDNQKYNKKNIPNYKEIFIDVNFEKIVKRDNKNLYKKALSGDLKNVVGVDIKFIPPFSPDLIINNNKENPDYEAIIQKIVTSLGIKINEDYFLTKKNLLKHPIKVQNIQYEGQNFLKQIISDRTSCLSFLKSRLNKLKSKNFAKIDLKKENFSQKNKFLLKNFLITLFFSDDKELEDNRHDFELLIHRFETSKKLFSIYQNKNITKKSLEFDEYINYCLFSLILGKYYIKSSIEKKIIYFNTILKVNDIISSVKYDLILFEEIYYSIKAIKEELNLIEEYLK